MVSFSRNDLYLKVYGQEPKVCSRMHPLTAEEFKQRPTNRYLTNHTLSKGIRYIGPELPDTLSNVLIFAIVRFTRFAANALANT